MTAKRFQAVVVQDDGTTACGIELPFSPKEVFGKARAPVRVTLRKHTFRTTTASMDGSSWIPLNRANREAAGVAAGDRVRVTMELDTTPRVVTPPPELAKALRANAKARTAWKKLSYTHQKEWAEAIREAKRPETRERRAGGADELARGPSTSRSPGR